jgi:Arc/MetJ-type ribon-helix-helix transcriptional regulator
MKSKTASVRLPKEMYEEIDELCDGIGCSRNDWIKDTLKDRLREELDENSQDQEVIKDTKPEPQEPHRIVIDEVEDMPEPKATVEFISDPTVKEIPQDNSNKPIIEFVSFNGELIPKADVYEI